MPSMIRDERHRHIARASLLVGLLGCTLLLTNSSTTDYDFSFATSVSRSLQSAPKRATRRAAANGDDDGASHRKLAKNGASPPAEDVVPGEYIIKPWVGYAASDVYESASQTRLALAHAQSSSNEGAQYESIDDALLQPVGATASATQASTNDYFSPLNVLNDDYNSRWGNPYDQSQAHLTVELDTSYNLREIFIQWWAWYANDFHVQVSPDGNDDSWTTVSTKTGFTGGAFSIDVSAMPAAQGVRFVRIVMTRRFRDGWTISKVKIWRQLEVATDYNAANAIDGTTSTRWSSGIAASGAEWLEVDTGGPQSLSSVTIVWEAAYAMAFEIQASVDRSTWTALYSETGKTSNAQTSVSVANIPGSHGSRYLRVYMTQRGSGFMNFSIYEIRVNRKPFVIGENPTGINCGSTITAVSSYLLGTYGGSLIQTYENAEFFSASLTSAQSAAMFQDNCVFTVEKNYIVRARGSTRRIGSTRNHEEKGEGERRRLAIPEFNLKDGVPANWGLERISSRGGRNGAYMWVHEGLETNVYIFDTGIYPDHSDWQFLRNDTSRFGDTLICTGQSNDYLNTDHGTFVASIAAGKTFGTARSAIFHSIQVLDGNGEGSTASLLCGMEKLLQDGKDYNAANYPKKIRSLVNLSLGVNGRSDALDKAVKDMTDVGYTVVIAAGDHNGNACFYSPYDHSAITVGALTDVKTGANTKTATSNYGECIDVWAPGEDIVGASNQGEYESVVKSGTSVAAAFVTGASALFFDEINTEIYPDPGAFTARVKDKILRKAEKDVLVDIGVGSINKIIQTTASACKYDYHCDYGLQCLMDGVCGDLSDYF